MEPARSPAIWMHGPEDRGEGTWTKPLRWHTQKSHVLLAPGGRSGPGWADGAQRQGACPSHGFPAVSRRSATRVGGPMLSGRDILCPQRAECPVTRTVPQAWF